MEEDAEAEEAVDQKQERKDKERQQKERDKNFDPKVCFHCPQPVWILFQIIPAQIQTLECHHRVAKPRNHTLRRYITAILWLQKFSLATAVALGCCSFEAYNAPYKSYGLKEVSVCGTEMVYMDRDFLSSRMSGVLEVRLDRIMMIRGPYCVWALLTGVFAEFIPPVANITSTWWAMLAILGVHTKFCSGREWLVGAGASATGYKASGDWVRGEDDCSQ